MIRINKSVSPGARWERSASKASQRLCNRFSNDPNGYLTGAKRFSFNQNIYGHIDVKNTLRAAQHDKCCYCEMVVGASGEIDHFRPKGDVRQHADETALTPGYYWLAYDWSNLFLSCPTCNQRHKKGLFPLASPQSRIRSHDDSELLANEAPLLIHPTLDDPEEHIGFHEEVAFPRMNAGKRSSKGEHSIHVFGLNRPDLRSQRRRNLDRISDCISLIQKVDAGHIELLTEEGRQLYEGMKQYLQVCVQDSEQFASMSRCAIQTAMD